ncbi:hypothetical protein BDW71DRAFT_186243 [Aspergillus fruticulosus]
MGVNSRKTPMLLRVANVACILKPACHRTALRASRHVLSALVPAVRASAIVGWAGPYRAQDRLQSSAGCARSTPIMQHQPPEATRVSGFPISHTAVVLSTEFVQGLKAYLR